MIRSQTTDALIIGGGIIGCSCAYFLRKAGVDVTILEQGEIGGQASGAAAGLLAPLGPIPAPGVFADLILASFRQFPAFVSELEAINGLDVGYQQTGSLRVVHSAKRLARLKQRFELWQTLGLNVNWIEGVEALKREPLLAPDVCGAVYAPEESQVNAVQLINALALSAQQAGAQIYPHIIVNEFLHSGTKVTGIRTASGDTYTCKQLIVTAGAWSAHLLRSLNDISVPLSPTGGQMLALSQPQPALQHIIFGDTKYLIPRHKEILVGATKEDSGFDIQVTPQATERLYNTALRLLPSLSSQNISRSWAGIRPTTPDKCPIIGPIPGWENLLVATGHNSVGIILSPVTGQSIAEYVTTGHLPQLIQPFGLERFNTPEFS
ncbi:glycine oxidase ThiO [Dictyobacter alpinus]|uniref:glycine oxidase n=1 Tax=Dictyobacter alpinus TaxID=2014873 RepID=A0A402BI64_9CHLR|nr:glycine oxidase ThiO [Dictyobacter alpinus]GCE31063.1 glycine oxidase ThiO [Dictyobacter alpinus]